ncbi:MAG: beta strand repeat-containing protein, partial [Verrucomicrobiota bacterium]
MKIRTVQNSASALAVLVGLTLALPAMAVDYVSVASGAWNNSANWNPVGIPGSSDTAQISSGFSITNTTSPTTLSPVTIDAGGAFIVGGSCTVGGLINNGTLTMGNNSSARILTISGSFTNNGLINTPSASPTHNIVFSGNGYWAGSGDISGVKAGVTVNAGATLDISGLTSALKVRSSGTLQLAINGTLITGTQVINGNGNGTATVTVGAAGQIITGNPNGLVNGTTGTFNLATVPSFNATSSVGLNGTSAQVTLGLPPALGNLTISNAVGVTLSAPVAISGTLALDAGTLVTSVSALPTVGPAGAVSGVGFVDGPLAQVYSGVGSKTFLTGKSGNGRPVTLNYTALTGTSTVTVEQFESAMGGTLPAATTQFKNRYWTVSQSGGSGFTFDLSLDGTGFSPAATAVILRQGSPDTSYTAAVAAPNYTGTGINAFGNFALGDFTPSSDQLVITTAPQNLTAGQISATMTVQLQDSGSAPKNAATDLTITLGTTSSGGLFRNVSDTTTISSVTITAGSSSASFKYRDTVAPGTPTITVSGGGANPGTQMETINLAPASKLAFTTQPVNGSMGVTLNQVVVQVQDAFGNNRPDSSVTVNLTLNGGTLASGTTSL